MSAISIFGHAVRMTHFAPVKSRGDRLACIKRERIFFSMHSAKARPKAHLEYTEKENAPSSGASPLTCRSRFNIGRILAERLVSVDAKLSLSTPLGGGGRGATALPIRRRFHRNRPTVLAATSAAAPVACDRGGLAAYDRFTVLWLFLSRFSSAVGNWLQCHASFLGKHIVQVSGALPVKSGFGVLQLFIQLG